MMPGMSRELMQEAVNLITEYGGASAAAKASGIRRSTLQNRYCEAKRCGITAPAKIEQDATTKINENLRDEIDRLKEKLNNATKPHFTVRQDNAGRTSKIRVVCIGDAHDSPALPDKSRFEWIGKYIKSSKPDVVVQIGDFVTLDSLNSHVPNETFAGKSKPSFMADMASFNEALEAMNLNGVERHCTLGNHERRLFLFEERAPEAYGMMQFELQRIFERHKWLYSPYGQITYYGGVGFVHAAINRLGKTYGGKTAENTIANDSIHDLVIGHSHTERRHRAPKIGGNNWVTILNVGCSLPDGHIEDYAQHSLTGWSYGIADMTIQHKKIQDYSFISMARLGDLYGRKTA